MQELTGHIKIDGKRSRLLYAWLLLSVSTLIFAGIFALLIALARTPLIQNLLPGKDYFYIALVGHVILAFVIWFLAFMGTLWVFTSSGFLNREPFSIMIGWASFFLTAIGAILITIPAIMGRGIPLIINYVPIIEHPLFYIGLILSGIGVLFTIVNALLTVLQAKRTSKEALPIETFGMALAGVAVLIAFLCIGLSYYFQALSADRKAFVDFERLFWGAGHILQFANTMAMVTAWIILARLTINKYPLGNGLAKILYLLYIIFVLPAPLIYFIYDIASQAHKDAFTELMRWGMGPSGVFIIVILIAIFSKKRRQKVFMV